ncbi:hypothetical protein KQ940_21570 [Marinobacterium sp. D7]|uniref:hypothetical protein n=1 Tax=Marinobacterium ramblicola TaxID=2849041 RepID=UPI001C2D56F1|nr:hypothetical protein [Marinobacterium ramblicola]MBV1790659.1 hypothetical protein [Marinobacterium ramblicola]
MSYIAWIIAIVGMCIELAGLLGFGLSWTLSGALLTVVGGILWGLIPPKSTR